MNYLHDLLRDILYSIVVEENIDLDIDVVCSYKTGYDLGLDDKEYALIRGPEILLSCNVSGYTGQAFTVAPRGYRGRLSDVFSLDLSIIYNRGIFYAVLNALLRMTGYIDRSVHCCGSEPRLCGKLLTRYLVDRYGSSVRVLHIGYHPGHVYELYSVFRDNLLITDLRSDVVWGFRGGRLVYDGIDNGVYVGEADIVLATGSSIINNTFWDIVSKSFLHGKKVIVYGVTGYGAVKLLRRYVGIDIDVFCPLAK